MGEKRENDESKGKVGVRGGCTSPAIKEKIMRERQRDINKRGTQIDERCAVKDSKQQTEFMSELQMRRTKL